jgi:competence protein ComEC
VKVRFLGGRRSCTDANNDSLVIRLDYGQKSILLTGDSEVDDQDYDHPGEEGCGGQLPYLLYRYRDDLSVLDVDVYKVGHHGSPNGTYDKFLEAVTPQYAVISAGDYRDSSPGGYHGFYFGHPREKLVKLLEGFVTGSRPTPVDVFTMKYPYQVKNPRRMEKGIYCTCWNTKALIVTLSNDGTPISITEVPQ